MKVVRENPHERHYLYMTLGPKGRKKLRDEAKRMNLRLDVYCEWAMTQRFGYLESLLADCVEETGARKTKWGKK